MSTETQIINTNQEIKTIKTDKDGKAGIFGWWTNSTLATKITYIRLAFVPLILFFYIGAIEFVGSDFFFFYGKLIAFILFAVACVTDWLDGYIARKHNQVTDTGKLLDPIVDKVLTLSAFVLIVTDAQILGDADFDRFLPVFAAALIIFIPLARDYIVNIIRQLAATKGITIPADKTAKIKTMLQFLALGMFLFYAADYNMDPSILGLGMFFDIYRYVAWFAMISATILTIVSCVIYVNKYNKIVKTIESKEEN
ncbi:MAG: CDP-diacylglycerol--glycerol-3-phosphate 3-phosphatidyltransferase [Firmicutes bacterium]|nr:CDP-diacylglycerol--glycerol-3-phosphate 3-phosphatidyltransferase [Bacillota bacterium]